MKRNAAVSPVIGSILMIVLTLIVAAIVGSFAGGLVETREKIPALTLQAEYSQSGDLTLTHIAGDPLPLSQISIRLTPSKTFGIDGIKNSRTIEKANFQNREKKHWNELTLMQVGETHRIVYDDIDGDATILDPTDINPAYHVTIPASVGKTFYLEIYYENNLIAKPEVMIKS